MRLEGQSGQYLGVQSSGALQNGIRAVHQPEVEVSTNLDLENGRVQGLLGGLSDLRPGRGRG